MGTYYWGRFFNLIKQRQWLWTRTQSRKTQVGSDAAEGQKQIGTPSKWIRVEETWPDQSMWSVIVLVYY